MTTPTQVIVESQQAEPSQAPSIARKAPAVVTYSRSWALALFVVDLSLFILSTYLAKLIAERVWQTPPLQKQIVGDAIVITLWILMFHALGLYRRTYAFRVKDELYYTVAALSLGVMPQLIVFSIVPAISTSRVGAVFALGLSIVLVGTGRALMHGLRSSLDFFGPNKSRIAIVGTGTRVREAVSSLDLSRGASPLLIEVDDLDATLTSSDRGDPVPLDSVEWFAKALQSRCDTLIFTEMMAPHLLPRLLDVAARYHMRVAFAPPRIKRHAFSLSIETSGSQALIVATQLNACTPTARLTKRIVDVIFATIALAIFLPVMVVCAIAIFLDSGRPLLYRQERVGMGGKRFNILKFRSMKVDAESEVGAVWVRENDDRRTRVGAIIRRLSFDELPQLFNVLRGEMSLVGPRPERPVFVEKFRQVLPRYDERHLVQPGITGWSHVQMRRLVKTSDMAERLEYDLRYLEQWSLWLDISILFKTAVEFLFQRAG
jgi:exopolysaccharide biosynthesis polyprenyl glycosylphosphotransferase